MIEHFLFLIFAITFIWGFHAVTRADKLLSFLGAYFKEELILQDIKRLEEKELAKYAIQFSEQIAFMNSEAEDQNNLIAKTAIGFSGAVVSLQENNPELRKAEEALEKRSRTFFFKFVKFIAPFWSECILCMSSFWGLCFMFLFYSGLMFIETPVPVFVFFAPFNLAGITSILQNNKLHQTNKELKAIQDSIDDLTSTL